MIRRSYILATFALFLTATAHAQNMDSLMQMGDPIDVSDVQLCDSRNPTSWRNAQSVEGVAIEEDFSCDPDMPALIAAAVRGTNNVSTETLNATGLAPDAVTKEDDKDGDGDPDVIRIHLEIVGLNEGAHSLTPYEIAPGVSPGFWAFAPKSTGMATENMSASYLMRMPSPSIRVEEGDEVYITVDNTHYMPHTMHLHGVDHPYISEDGEGNDGVPQTSEEPIMPGESRTYEITPRTPGTMAYHCHVKPDVHVLMGLSGMLIVEENRPNNSLETINVGAGKVRHRSASSRVDYDGEFDLHYQDIDKEMNDLVKGTDDIDLLDQRINEEYDITERTADYFILNGKSFPYTLRESQLIVDPNKKYRLRVLNIGSETVSLHTHGHKVLVKALDGIDLQSPYYRDVVDIHAAQRADLILNTTNDGLNSYGEGVWLFHDHEESHITTDGVSPGGGLSTITYRSFLGDEGVPIVQGMDIRPYFTAEFYDRSRNDSDMLAADTAANKKTGIILAVIILGLVLGFFGSKVIQGRRRMTTSAIQPPDRGFVYAHTLYVIAVCTILFLLVFVMQVSAVDMSDGEVSAETSNSSMQGIDKIHIMPDGSVMLGTGVTLPDAYITPDGRIILGSGEEVTPVLDMRSDKTLGVKVEEPVANEVSADTPVQEEKSGLGEGDAGAVENMLDEAGMTGGTVHTGTSNADMSGIEGIHIMPNGRVMLGTGVWLSDAEITADGTIILGSGEEVTPILDMRSGNGIRRTSYSMVVNENFDRLPLGCSAISEEKSITVKAGTEIAEGFPGTVYTYDTHSIEDVKPCTLLTVTFENMDDVRHQFMVHDLPTDTYPMGMFNIEVTGPAKETGTFITPPDQETLLVHCGIPEHEAKGMIAQIKNGGGSGDLPNIPGITRSIMTDVSSFSARSWALWGLLGIFLGVMISYVTRFLQRHN